MKRPLALVAFAFIVLFASCKKDSENKPNDNNPLIGNYKFKYLYSRLFTTTEGAGEKAATLNDFTTIDNQGNLEFTSTDLKATGLSYGADAIVKYYEYDGADIIDSTDFPFNWNLPPMEIEGPYRLIGTDSVYFPEGSFITGAPGQPTGAAGGGKLSWSGNTLTITQHLTIDSTYTEFGETFRMRGSGIANIVMEKQ